MIRTLAAVVAGLLAVGAVASAQTAVSVRPVVSPGRTIHVTTTQELSIAASGVAGAASGQLGMQSQGTLAFTQVNKSFNAQGEMEADVTIDQLEMTRHLNGMAEDQSAAKTMDLVGSTLVAVFDRTGKLGTVRVPQELQANSASARQLLSGAYGLLNGIPAFPMAIGETQTVDASVLPLRLPGAVAASAPKLTITLRAIDRVEGDRIAHLTQNVETSGQANQLSINGSGTIDVNLDKGFVTASAMNWNIAGNLPGAATASALEPPQVRATFKMTLSASE